MGGFGGWLNRLRAKTALPAATSQPHVGSRGGGAQTFADGNNEFAIAMYEQLRQRPGNVFFCPFGVRIVLGMAQAGAKGDTAAQLREALRTSSSDESVHADFAETLKRVKASGSEGCEVTLTNSLWIQKGEQLRPEFLEVSAQYYDGPSQLVDFRANAEVVRVTVNQWIKEATKEKISEVIPPGAIDAETRFILVSAIYFKGRWAAPFHEEDTRNEPFYLEGGGQVRAPLMYMRMALPYLHARDYQAVDLAYRGGDVSMLLLLPNRKNGLDDLEKTLSAGMLHDCVVQMHDCEVRLLLPRFTITWGSFDLRDQLNVLGVRRAFTRFQADFSGINGRESSHKESLFISSVLHRAFIEANEEGTEAAAATALTMVGSALSAPTRIPIFRADHAFLFAIRDRKTEAILFLGRVSDPTRKS